MTNGDLDDLEAFVDETMPALNLRGQTRITLVYVLSELFASSGRLDHLEAASRSTLLEALAERLLSRASGRKSEVSP